MAAPDKARANAAEASAAGDARADAAALTTAVTPAAANANPSDPVEQKDGNETVLKGAGQAETPDPAEKPKDGVYVIDLNQKNDDADPRALAAAKLLHKQAAAEGVASYEWDIHNPAVFRIKFED